MAKGQFALGAGVYKLSQILGKGRKSGRVAEIGSSPHPLGQGVSLTNPVSPSAVNLGRNSLRGCHPMFPASLPLTEILEGDPQNWGGGRRTTVSKEHG